MNVARVEEVGSDGAVRTLHDTVAGPVHGAALLRDVEAFISRFIVLPPSALLPVALWAIGTHVFGRFETFPYLALLSTEKGCGKTRTTEVLEQIVARPVRAVCVSEAAMFRLIESQMPTLILDEAEVLTGKGERAEAIRALLNSGNRAGAHVPRCVGNSHELRMFQVYCPKIVCAIRVCPETVRDRSVVIPMQRKKPSESVERFILRRIRPEGDTLRKRIEALSRGSESAIVHAYERLAADFLSDRDMENWEPLLAILTAADASRLEDLRANAEILTARKVADNLDDSLSLRLLMDTRAVWPENERKIFTAELLKRLKGIDDGPWTSDERFDARRLSRFLRPFEVRPESVQIGAENLKGYYREHAEAAFSRYLDSRPSGPAEPA